MWAEPGDGVLEGFRLTPDGVVTRVRHGTQVVLRQHAPGDTAGRTLAAPGPGVARLAVSPSHRIRGLIYAFSSWTEPTHWLQSQPGSMKPQHMLQQQAQQQALDSPRSVPVSLGYRALPPDLPELVITDVEVPSDGGVLVPMTVLHRKGLKLDGSNPVLLQGYAPYGLSESAGFSATHTVWIEHGGVLAVINPRGSGVNGDDWYRAGFQATKPNTWKDGIAGARWLIDKGYGSPATMGIIGGSAGGIFVGRATTEAPELFAAAVYSVGMLDTLRSEFSANGATNVSEFGTVTDPADFQSLLAMSTYRAIRDGVRYPAVLLVHGMNDPRVGVWESGKTAARLQAAEATLTDARPVLLRLDMQAGHGIGSTLNQREALAADTLSFLLWQMGKTTLAPWTSSARAVPNG
ncbi:MAG: prolyl oligopeptidase family serine peptidase [Rubrivivax sp.]